MYSMIDLLDKRAEQRPRDVVVDDGHSTLTYAGLRERAAAEAAALAAAGVTRGDRVAVLLPRSADGLAVFFGAQLLGAVVIFVSDVLKPIQVSYILAHSGACVAVTDDRLHAQLANGPLGADQILHPGAPADKPTEQSERPIGADLAMLMYTSGSTGMPKGVMFTHENLLKGAEIVAGYLELTTADRILSVLPWSFDYGFSQVLSAMWAGGTVVVARSAHAPDVCRLLAERRVTGLAGVPPLWEILAGRLSPFLRSQLPYLRYVTNTGGALRPATLAALRRAHPHTAVYLMYGLTEAFRSTYLPPGLVDEHPDSMGRAIPGTQVLVVDEEGRECPPGAVGELVHRGPTVAAGYWNDPEATARVFRPYRRSAPGSTGETVVHSGDYVRRDADGLLYYVGRRDELFKRRGMRVNPAEVEAFLLGTGLVAHAVVFATPGDEPDPDVVAVVVPSVPGDDVTALAAECREGLPAFQRPSRLLIRDDLPRTGSGKIDRTAVKAAALVEQPIPEPPR